MAEVKAAKKKGKGKSKSSYTPNGLRLGAIHNKYSPTNPTVLSVISKEVVAIDSQANVSLVNDLRAFEPETYREFDESDSEQHAIIGFDGVSSAVGIGTANLVLYDDAGDPVIVKSNSGARQI